MENYRVKKTFSKQSNISKIYPNLNRNDRLRAISYTICTIILSNLSNPELYYGNKLSKMFKNLFIPFYLNQNV
jgi:hypothetical protein